MVAVRTRGNLSAKYGHLWAKRAGIPSATRSADVKRGQAMSAVLEETLQFQCGATGLPVPVRQFPFTASLKRRHAADLAWPELKLLVEIQGGIWRADGGAHSTGKAIERDIEKQQLAVILGYALLPVTPQQVKSGKALEVVRQALTARGWSGVGDGY